jgi:hypothetical protein
MAGSKPTTGDDIELHEALTKKLYGCPLDDMLAVAFERGRRRGCAEGHAAGYRKAKGREESIKANGRPPIIGEPKSFIMHENSLHAVPGLTVMMVNHVRQRARGGSIKAAVTEFLKIMKSSQVDHTPVALPSLEQALNCYYQRCKKVGS